MAENEENTPQPRPFPEGMVVDPESHTVAHQIREYLWGKGPIDYPVVSAHLKRELVSKFVRFELDDLPAANYGRVRILFDLYGLREHLGIIESMLDRSEKVPEELVRSSACTIILEEIGDESQKKAAPGYYEYLVGNQFATQNFDELLKCLAVFGPQVLPDSLKKKMAAAAGGAGLGNEPDVEVEKREIEDLLENEFFFIAEANKARSRIDAIENRDQRFEELLKVYVEATEDGGAEYLDLWIQQQIRRSAEEWGRPRVIDAIRAFAGRLSDLAGVDEEFARIRLFHAIEFFEGELTADEAAFMAENRQKQVDPLRYAPIPVQYEPVEPEIEDTIDDD